MSKGALACMRHAQVRQARHLEMLLLRVLEGNKAADCTRPLRPSRHAPHPAQVLGSRRRGGVVRGEVARHLPEAGQLGQLLHAAAEGACAESRHHYCYHIQSQCARAATSILSCRRGTGGWQEGEALPG